jgi:hypothetical protein
MAWMNGYTMGMSCLGDFRLSCRKWRDYSRLCSIDRDLPLKIAAELLRHYRLWRGA